VFADLHAIDASLHEFSSAQPTSINVIRLDDIFSDFIYTNTYLGIEKKEKVQLSIDDSIPPLDYRFPAPPSALIFLPPPLTVEKFN
jgi:hypothetical protein